MEQGSRGWFILGERYPSTLSQPINVVFARRDVGRSESDRAGAYLSIHDRYPILSSRFVLARVKFDEGWSLTAIINNRPDVVFQLVVQRVAWPSPLDDSPLRRHNATSQTLFGLDLEVWGNEV